MSSPLHRSAASALFFFFFFNDTATTEIYTLSLHDALPISCRAPDRPARQLLGHLRVHRALRSPRGGAGGRPCARRPAARDGAPHRLGALPAGLGPPPPPPAARHRELHLLQLPILALRPLPD